MISTGISVEIPENYMGMACSRSGHGKIKVRLANSVGIIDHEYRGELKLLVENEGSNTFNITKHMRIAQLVIVPVALPMFEVFEGAIEEWQNTSRGASGFGSSGS
jgi:dUTP pyrophosphatase